MNSDENKKIRDAPRPFTCERCKNVIGVIRRDNNRLTVLDVFRFPVLESYFEQVVEKTAQKEYAALSLKEGGCPCAGCGQIKPWYANEAALNYMLRRREERLQKNAV